MDQPAFIIILWDNMCRPECDEERENLVMTYKPSCLALNWLTILKRQAKTLYDSNKLLIAFQVSRNGHSCEIHSQTQNSPGRLSRTERTILADII